MISEFYKRPREKHDTQQVQSIKKIKFSSEPWEISNLITALSPIEPSSIKNLQDLFEISNQQKFSEGFSQRVEFIQRLVHNLVFRQFGCPIEEAIREAISNACDANYRKGLDKDSLIQITLENGILRIIDKGDGMNSSSIPTFLVPGRSSNQEAIFQLENGIPKVTGRFGIGGLSLLLFLLYQSSPHYTQLPTFYEEEGKLKLRFLFEINNKPYEVIFSTHSEQEDVNCEIRPLPSKKIEIQTCKEGDFPLQIKMKERQGKVSVKIQDGCQERSGTTFTISSPLIQENQDKISKAIQNIFNFVSDIPIFLNDKQLNCFDNYHSITFKGGNLYFLPKESQKGEVSICEGGKVIVKFTPKESTVFEQVAISFLRLPLSQDRASIDWKDSLTLEGMQDLLRSILKSNELSWDQKSYLLNSLAPILDQKYFDLIPFIQQFFCQPSSVRFLPNLPEVRKIGLKETIYLHPDYLEKLQLPTAYVNDRFQLYVIKSDSLSPCQPMAFKWRKKWHFILDEQFISKNNRGLSRFNLNLLEIWGSHLYPQFSKEISHSNPTDSLFPLPTLEIQEEIQPIESDILKYESKPDANQLISYNEMQKIAKEYSSELNAFQWLLLNLQTQPIPKKYFYYLWDFYENNEVEIGSGIGIHNFIGDFFRDSLKKISLTLVSQTLEKAWQVVKTLKKKERENYCHFLSYQIQQNLTTNKRFSFEELHQAYKKTKDFVELLGNIDKDRRATIFRKPPNLEKLELLRSFLIRLSPENQDKVCSVLFQLNDIPFFLNINSDQDLNQLVELITYTHPNNLPPNIIRPKNYRDSCLIESHCMQLSENEYDCLLKNVVQTQNSEEWKTECAGIYLSFLHFKKTCSFVIDAKQFLKKGIQLISNNHSEELEIAKDLYDNFSRLMDDEFLIRDIAKMLNQLNGSLSPTELAKQIKDLAPSYGRIHKLDQTSIESLVKEVFTLSGLNKKYQQNPNSQNKENILAYRLDQWEKKGLLTDSVRPFIYIALLATQFKTENFSFVHSIESMGIPLHEDPEVIGSIGSSFLARRRIQGALLQNPKNRKLYFGIGEMIFNGLEAGAGIVKIEAHLDEEEIFTVVIKDNGSGMGRNELRALKTPGLSTKNLNNEDYDQNYGHGFFSSLSDFDEVLVDTSQSSSQHLQMEFKKEKDGIFIRSGETQEKRERGTTFILKKRNSEDTTLELIQLKCFLMETCPYIQGIELFFNDQKINNIQEIVPTNLIEYKVPFTEQGKYIGEIQINVGSTKEGIYRKGLKICSSIPDSYLEYIPQNLLKRMKEEGAKISILLPGVEQTMNRNFLIDKGALSLVLQKSLLQVAIQYTHQKWLMGQNLQLLSKDYFTDFRMGMINLSLNFQKTSNEILEFYHEKPKEIESEEKTLKNNILQKAKEFFQKSEYSLCYPYSFSSLLSIIEEKEQQTENKDRMQQVKKVFNDQQPETINLLASLPLYPNGPSLVEMRASVANALIENGLIDIFGEYELKCIQDHSLEKLNQWVTNSIQQVRNQWPMFDLNNILNYFETSIQGRIESIQKQISFKNEDIQEDDKILQPLVKFLQRTAKEILGKEIGIQFHNVPNGTLAHTYRGSHTLVINLCNPKIKKFWGIITSPSFSIDSLSKKNLSIILEWLETLAHEMTHMEENQECTSTHDDNFNEKMGQLMQHLFIQRPKEGEQNQLNVLDIMKEISQEFQEIEA